MSGNIHLLKNNFAQAKGLFGKSESTAKDESQIYSANLNLAKWTILKIEKEGINSFGSKKSILHQLKQAEKRIQKCRSIRPGQSWHEDEYEKLKRLNLEFSKFL
jgi:RIO-like serine/threonine protein kinase